MNFLCPLFMRLALLAYLVPLLSSLVLLSRLPFVSYIFIVHYHYHSSRDVYSRPNYH